MTTLKDAQKNKKKMREFIAEHSDVEGDEDRFDEALKSMTEQGKKLNKNKEKV